MFIIYISFILIIAVERYLHVCVPFLIFWDNQRAWFQYVIAHYIYLYDIQI